MLGCCFYILKVNWCFIQNQQSINQETLASIVSILIQVTFTCPFHITKNKKVHVLIIPVLVRISIGNPSLGVFYLIAHLYGLLSSLSESQLARFQNLSLFASVTGHLSGGRCVCRGKKTGFYFCFKCFNTFESFIVRCIYISVKKENKQHI